MIPNKLLIHMYGDIVKKEKLAKSRKRKLFVFGVLGGSYLGYNLGYFLSDK